MSVSRQEVINRIRKWQEFPYVHQLTCGRGNCGAVLEPREVSARVVLECPEEDCDYTQNWIPDYFMGETFELRSPEVITGSGDS